MKKITYITGNQYKVVGAKGFLEPLGFEIDAKDIDCPEIQADTMEEVAKFSSKYASDLLKKNTLKNNSIIERISRCIYEICRNNTWSRWSFKVAR